MLGQYPVDNHPGKLKPDIETKLKAKIKSTSFRNGYTEHVLSPFKAAEYNISILELGIHGA